MIAIGFGVEKLGGSSWIIPPPPEFGYNDGVYMHEPHSNKGMFRRMLSRRA
jgi:hypothetical protein